MVLWNVIDEKLPIRRNLIAFDSYLPDSGRQGDL